MMSICQYLMSDHCKVHTCPSSGDDHSVHRCPQFQSGGGQGTGDKKNHKIILLNRLHQALKLQTYLIRGFFPCIVKHIIHNIFLSVALARFPFFIMSSILFGIKMCINKN